MTDLPASETQQELILDRLLHLQRPSRFTRWFRVGAIGVATLVVALSLSALKPPLPSLSLWDLRDAQRTADWLHAAAHRSLIQATTFLLLGSVIGWLGSHSVRPQRATFRGLASRDHGHPTAHPSAHPKAYFPAHPARLGSVVRLLIGLAWHAVVVSGLLAVLLGVCCVLVWSLVDAVGWSLALDGAVALIGFCLGLWLAWWAARGWRGWAALLLHGCIAVALGLLASGWLAARLLSGQPYSFPQIEVTSADKRRLVDIVNETSEVRDQGRIYHVTEEQLNQLLAWWFSVQSIDGKAKVTLGDREQQAWCSLHLPAWFGLARPHVNATAIGRCEIASERLELDVPALEIGTLRLPPSLTRWVSRQVTHWVNDDPRNRAMLLGVVAADARRDGVDVFLAHDSNRRRRLSQLFAQLNDFPDVTAAVAYHLTQFNQIAAKARRQDPVFEMIVKDAFATARQRSRFRDPVLENRAAILALGIALGHTHMAVFVGDLDEATLRGPLARLPYVSRLRGRGDWPRHFWVSAAITLVASNRVSDALGLLKEELDADTGGSGFSFADLAADRAGTEFAKQATASRESARRIQYWILGEATDLDELMPAADDLPEGLSDADLLDRYGGVGGSGFEKTQAGIEQRVRQLPWWTKSR